MKKTCSFIFLCFACLLIGCQKKTGAADQIKVVLKKYSFDPSVIHVKSGETVEIEATTLDVQHGFDIPALGIKEPVQPGRTTTFTFTAPAKGEYEIKCGVICGPHHDDMLAKLVVE